MALDGEILAVLVSAGGLLPSVHESHLLGAPPGQHTIRVSASRSAAATGKGGGEDDVGNDGTVAAAETVCSGTVRFLSIPKDAGEWTEELAELRGRPLRPEARAPPACSSSAVPLPTHSRKTVAWLTAPSVTLRCASQRA